MKKNNKELYRVDLNWYGETHTFYRYAINKVDALNLATRALASDLMGDFSLRSVQAHVHDGHDRYLVTKEPN